ncbi:unnamed protein product [Calypogeia fissa]
MYLLHVKVSGKGIEISQNLISSAAAAAAPGALSTFAEDSSASVSAGRRRTLTRPARHRQSFLYQSQPILFTVRKTTVDNFGHCFSCSKGSNVYS